MNSKGPRGDSRVSRAAVWIAACVIACAAIAIAAWTIVPRLNVADEASGSSRIEAEPRVVAPEPRAVAPSLIDGQEFDDCDAAGWCPRMIVIPAGSFMMGMPPGEEAYSGYAGAEGPLHHVSLQRFAVGKFEVTFVQWAACVDGGGCSGNANPDDQGWGSGERPVIDVSWNDAQEYVHWLSRSTGQTYRLMTEAEWEYAARSGTTTSYSTGASISLSQANFSGGRTQPVGSYPKNGFGLHDVHGNVWEWVEDCWNANYDGAPTNGFAWINGDCSNRNLRGGSWGAIPLLLRSAFRLKNRREYRSYDIGFRLARNVEPI